jgi:hypothetical protein
MRSLTQTLLIADCRPDRLDSTRSVIGRRSAGREGPAVDRAGDGRTTERETAARDVLGGRSQCWLIDIAGGSVVVGQGRRRAGDLVGITRDGARVGARFQIAAVVSVVDDVRDCDVAELPVFLALRAKGHEYWLTNARRNSLRELPGGRRIHGHRAASGKSSIGDI